MLRVNSERVVLRDPTEDDLRDETNAVGRADLVAEFRPDATDDDILETLTQCNERGFFVYPAGGRSSVTKAMLPETPKDEYGVIFDFSNMQGMEAERYGTGYLVKAQPGVTMEHLEAAYPDAMFPPAPTHNGATVAGTIACHGNGAKGYKYGDIKNWLTDARLLTPTGGDLNILDLYSFQLDLPLPKDVLKISAGYDPELPVVGSEGTLGVIPEATIWLPLRPPLYMAMMSFDSDQQALEFLPVLRSQEPEKRQTFEPGGIAGVEFISEKAVNLIRHREEMSRFAGAKALLLVQIEGYDSFEKFAQNMEDAGIDTDNATMAMSEDSERKKLFLKIRESVPDEINSHNRRNGVIKVASDICVRPEDIAEAIGICVQEFGEEQVDHAEWAHAEGNVHSNAKCRDMAEVYRALAATIRIAQRIIAIGGAPLSEHGIGKNTFKQQIAEMFHGPRGMAEMQRLKHFFDPNYIMNPGSIFPIHKL